MTAHAHEDALVVTTADGDEVWIPKGTPYLHVARMHARSLAPAERYRLWDRIRRRLATCRHGHGYGGASCPQCMAEETARAGGLRAPERCPLHGLYEGSPAEGLYRATCPRCEAGEPAASRPARCALHMTELASGTCILCGGTPQRIVQ